MDQVEDGYEDVAGMEDVFYTVTRVPGPGAPSQLLQVFKDGCSCQDKPCSVGTCECLCFGTNYESGVLVRDKFGDSPVVECHGNCSCSVGCTNRHVQFGPVKGLEVFKTEKKGFGVKTLTELREGSFVCEYAGEVISEDEAIRREAQRGSRMNYIFVLREERLGEELVTCVDPSVVGNIGRFVNHSCQPNSAVVPVRVDGPVPLLCVFTLRHVLQGEEITYDYSGGTFTHKQPGRNLQPCFCDAQRCRQWLPYNE